MLSLVVPLLTLHSLTALAAPHRAPPKQHPVCIIGAGPAGLSAAGKLEQKGIEAVIFDEQAEVGGKCQAWYDEQYVFHGVCILDAADYPLRGIFHPLGAAFYSNVSYPETLKVINQTNVTSEPFYLAGTRASYRYNYVSGAIDKAPPTPLTFSAALQAEIPRYTALWNERFRPISEVNYKVRHLCNSAVTLVNQHVNRMACQKNLQFRVHSGFARTTSPPFPSSS